MAQTFKDMWRPVYEQWATIGWGTAAVALLFAAIPYQPIVVGMCAAAALTRAKQAWDMYRFRLSISAERLSFVSIGEMLERTRFALDTKKALWAGRGFVWGQRHAQLAWEIASKSPEEIPTLPQWLPARVRQWLLPKDSVMDPHAMKGAASWVHGLEPDERDLYMPLAALSGHTLIVGTTGAGKTALYKLQTFQAIHAGATVIVFDPKGAKDWERELRAECERCGREYLYFHLAFPSKSCRINPLATWNNPSEVASRISPLLAGEAGGDGFVDFADSTISRIVAGEVMIGVRPTLKSIKRYVEHGVEKLLEQCFQVFFPPLEGPNWDAALAPLIPKEPSRAHAMVKHYQQYVRGGGDSNETIDGLITVLNYDREWFSRVIVRLVPLLQRLATGDVGDLLSPDVGNFDDPRPVYTMEKIITDRKVLYVGADMLSNKMVGSATLSMLLADMAAAAGAVYNFGVEEDVYLFMDEAAEGINDQAIQILNKGRGAGFKVFIATQTLADLEVRLGKKAKALQVLGNTNNLICLRARDYETAKLVSEIMGETAVQKINTSHNMGSETEATAVEFRGSVTRSTHQERAPLVSPDILLKLPNLQYFGMWAGGHIVKGRLDIIET